MVLQTRVTGRLVTRNIFFHNFFSNPKPYNDNLCHLVELKKAHMDKLVSPFKNYTRSSFALEDDWFIFLLPQSVFKIHPLYDTVMAQILVHNESIHLMVTGGRRQSWTDIYKERLRKSITDLDQTGKGFSILKFSA